MTNTGRPLFELNDQRQRHLNACAAQGLSLTRACRELSVDPKTLYKAAERRGLMPWLKAKFPGQGYSHKARRAGEYQVITLDELREQPPQIDTSLPHVRAAMMPWRVSA